MVSAEESSELSINAMHELKAAENFEHILRMELTLQQVDSTLLNLKDDDSSQLSETASEAKDMHQQILNMVKGFETEAKLNSNEENINNLKQLTDIKKEMDTALNHSQQTPEQIAEQFTNEFFETEGKTTEPAANTTEEPAPVLSALPKKKKIVIPKMAKVPKSTASGKKLPNMTELKMNPNAKTYEEIKNNISILSAILPKLKDAGQRAGLVKKFSPKIETAMAELEKNIMDEKNEKAQVKMKKTKNLVSSIVKAKLAEKEIKEEISEPAVEATEPVADEAKSEGAAASVNFVDGAIAQAQKIKSLENQISNLEKKNKAITLQKSIKEKQKSINDKQNRLKKLHQIQKNVANSKAVQDAEAKLAQAHRDKMDLEANANIEAIVSKAQGEPLPLAEEEAPTESQASEEEAAAAGSTEVVVPVPILAAETGAVKADPEIEDPEEEETYALKNNQQKQKVLHKAALAVKSKLSYAQIAKKNAQLKKQLLKNKQQKQELLRKLNQQKEIQVLQQNGLSLDSVQDEEKEANKIKNMKQALNGVLSEAESKPNDTEDEQADTDKIEEVQGIAKNISRLVQNTKDEKKFGQDFVNIKARLNQIESTSNTAGEIAL